MPKRTLISRSLLGVLQGRHVRRRKRPRSYPGAATAIAAAKQAAIPIAMIHRGLRTVLSVLWLRCRHRAPDACTLGQRLPGWCRLSGAAAIDRSPASSGRESRIDRLAVGHLTLAAASAGHPVRGMYELKLAAHVLTVRSTEIGQDPARGVRDELRPGTPVPPVASPAATPPGPQGPEVIDSRVGRDLQELSAVGLAVGQRRIPGSADRIGRLPVEVDRVRAGGGRGT